LQVDGLETGFWH